MKYDAHYFGKYYTRYYPSRKRLYEKIEAKVSDPSQRASLQKSLASLIVEDLVIEDRVRNLLLKGKSHRYIYSNLYQKGFEKGDIDSALTGSDYADDFTLLTNSLGPKIGRWIEQGKSRQEIRQRLFEHSEFKSQLQDYLDESYSEEQEEEVLNDEIKKLQMRGVSQDKIIQRLGGRGFQFSAILKLL